MTHHSKKRYIELTMEFRKEGNLWTGVCKELGTATDGETFEEVTESLKAMVFLHLNTLEDVGECERFLKEHGVEIHYNEHVPPRNIPMTYNPNQYFNRQLIPLGSC